MLCIPALKLLSSEQTLDLLPILYIPRNENHVDYEDCPNLLCSMFQMFADMIYKHGFVHCDPHAGNILVRKREDGIDEVVLLDHGLYTVSCSHF